MQDVERRWKIPPLPLNQDGGGVRLAPNRTTALRVVVFGCQAQCVECVCRCTWQCETRHLLSPITTPPSRSLHPGVTQHVEVWIWCGPRSSQSAARVDFRPIHAATHARSRWTDREGRFDGRLFDSRLTRARLAFDSATLTFAKQRAL
jgi:hypothetical protein